MAPRRCHLRSLLGLGIFASAAILLSNSGRPHPSLRGGRISGMGKGTTGADARASRFLGRRLRGGAKPFFEMEPIFSGNFSDLVENGPIANGPTGLFRVGKNSSAADFSKFVGNFLKGFNCTSFVRGGEEVPEHDEDGTAPPFSWYQPPDVASNPGPSQPVEIPCPKGGAVDYDAAKKQMDLFEKTGAPFSPQTLTTTPTRTSFPPTAKVSHGKAKSEVQGNRRRKVSVQIRKLIPADVYDAGSQLVIRCDLPGLVKENINVECHGNVLTVTAQRRTPAQPPAGITRTTHHDEIPSGSYSRKFRVPAQVDTSTIDASYADGVLTVKMNKQLRTQEKVNIAVN